MEGNSFLIRIPNGATRARVLTQRLWQINGQTMFVAKWEPGFVPEKPELTAAPIWLELREVPLQFFNEDGLERIASQVGHPKVLHPTTVHKTNLEVAKVLTLIDPRKPLPESVNVQFDNGEVRKVGVSSPWMPPVCDHCKEIGHSVKRCNLVSKPCGSCNSSTHTTQMCPSKNPPKTKAQKGKAPAAPKPPAPIYVKKVVSYPTANQDGTASLLLEVQPQAQGHTPGECSKSKESIIPPDPGKAKSANSESSSSSIEPDSSDVSSSPEDDPDYDDEYGGFTKVLSKRQQKLLRGKGPKNL